MTDIPLAKALLLWNSALNGGTPAFAVRPLGHDDYYRTEKYQYSGGACYSSWREKAEKPAPALIAQAMIDIWHIVAFYGVPVEMVHEGMLAVPEYRNTLADDCLPQRYRHECD